MTNYGSAYRAARAVFKREAAARNEPCWICGCRIDYNSPFDPSAYNPKLFHLDHATATGNGGDVVRSANFRASCAECNTRRGKSDRGLFNTSRDW